MAEAPPETAPMEVETPEEEEEEACMYASRFTNWHGYTATGSPTSKSFMLAVLSKMPEAKHKNIYASLKGTRSKKADALMKLLDTDKALERDILDHRRRDVKNWNKERRAEEKAAAGVVDDGPLSYPEVGESNDVLKGALQERLDLLAVARKRYGDNHPYQLAQKLSKSNASEDRDLVAKLIAHRNARVKAYRKALSSAGGREGRDDRALGSAVAPTLRADPVSWSDEAGKTADTALVEVLEPLDVTPPKGDAKWDAIAVTVSTASGRDYTGKQCYNRASNEGYLRAELPKVEIYDPSMRDWRPRAMERLLRAAGLDSKVKCGKAALKADAFKHVSTTVLYERLRDVYNLGTKLIMGDREKIIAALVEAGSCAVDPRDHGATSFEGASSARFNRALFTEMGPRLGVLASLQASEKCLESPSDGDDLGFSNGAIYGRLAKQNTTHLCFLKLGLASYEAPPTYMTSTLNEFFFRPLYMPHVEYDAAQDCTCCRGLYEDNGFATCVEHDHGVQFGCCAIRNNGACQKCNRSWIEFFDKLAREFKIETLREKRDVAVAANKRWGHLSPRRSAWKYD